MNATSAAMLQLLQSIDASLKLLVAMGNQKAPRRAKEVPLLKHRAIDPCIGCIRRSTCATRTCQHKDEYDAGQRWLADQHAQGKTGAEGSAA